MAFHDPIAVFKNLRRMLKPNGRIAFVCWRALVENELDYLPVQVSGLAGRVDATPFSFELRETIDATLTQSGFTGITIRALDMPVTCGGVEETLTVLTTVGALGKILRDRPEMAPAVTPKLRQALIARESNGQVWLGAAVWIVTARA